mmetsp:Transcript_20904/g.32367  ORF Transcript_20904/g.32367 Transcript_20904/m.32367 type:complete len:327 (+) Transcript_20904:1264-2244(+)
MVEAGWLGKDDNTSCRVVGEDSAGVGGINVVRLRHEADFIVLLDVKPGLNLNLSGSLGSSLSQTSDGSSSALAVHLDDTNVANSLVTSKDGVTEGEGRVVSVTVELDHSLVLEGSFLSSYVDLTTSVEDGVSRQLAVSGVFESQNTLDLNVVVDGRLFKVVEHVPSREHDDVVSSLGHFFVGPVGRIAPPSDGIFSFLFFDGIEALSSATLPFNVKVLDVHGILLVTAVDEVEHSPGLSVVVNHVLAVDSFGLPSVEVEGFILDLSLIVTLVEVEDLPLVSEVVDDHNRSVARLEVLGRKYSHQFEVHADVPMKLVLVASDESWGV